MNTVNPTPIPAKPWWKSKTVLLNVGALISLAIPAAAQWLKENPVELVTALVSANVLVRFVTSGKISIFGDDDDSLTGTGVSGKNAGAAGRDTGSHDSNQQRMPAFPWLVGAACVALLFLLPGCKAFDALSADYDTKGEVMFLSEDGAKAGLRFEPGKPITGFARVAIRDPETGKVTGYSYVEISKRAKVVAEK